MSNAFVNTFTFPEGEFDFIRCLIKTDDDVTFETWIGIGVDVNFDSCSERMKLFDNGVYAYAADMQEFWGWVSIGGWDFTILDYERKVDET